MENIKYKCPECGWVGTEKQMEADCYVAATDEEPTWSNCICPSCRSWFELDDYELITDTGGK